MFFGRKGRAGKDGADAGADTGADANTHANAGGSGRRSRRGGGKKTQPETSSAPPEAEKEQARIRGRALREEAKERERATVGAGGPGGATPGPPEGADGGRRGDRPTRGRKPRFAPGAGEAHPNGSGETTPGYYRPQGSLVVEPYPTAENLPPPEKLHGTKRDALARLTALAMAGSFVVFLFLALYLPLSYILTGGASQDAGPGAAVSEAATEARAIAEPFAAAYLEVNPGEGPDAAQARVTPFVAADLPPDVVAAQAEGEVERRVLSTAVYRTEKLRDDRWAVYTENLVATTSAEAPPEVQDPLAGTSSTQTGTSFSTPDGQSTTTVRRVGLMVFVAAAPSGGVAVDAPPRLITPRAGFGGEVGAIADEEPLSLSDGAVSELLEGYFAAAYGSDVSRQSIENFLAPGTDAPPQPVTGLEYLGLEDGVVYEAPVPRGSDWDQAYEVEAYVTVRDPEVATTSTQTHVLTVAETAEGWKVAGGPDSVN